MSARPGPGGGTAVRRWLSAACCCLWLVPAPSPGADPALRVRETDEYVEVETDALAARVRKKGYGSGIAAGSFLDKKTGARDVGFGLHIMDFLLAPGWRDDGYTRDKTVHGD